MTATRSLSVGRIITGEALAWSYVAGTHRYGTLMADLALSSGCRSITCWTCVSSPGVCWTYENEKGAAALAQAWLPRYKVKAVPQAVIVTAVSTAIVASVETLPRIRYRSCDVEIILVPR